MTIALDKVLLHVAAELHVNAVQHAIIGVACQNPAAPGQQRHPRPHLHLYLHPLMLRLLAAIASTATSSTRNSAAPHRPEPHGTEAVDRRGQNTAITTFRSPAQTKGPGRSIFEEHFRTDEEVNSWQNITLMHS